MPQKTKKILSTLWAIVLSVSIAAAGLCLMAQCLSIYRSGDHPFTPETVAAAFSQIALPVYLCGALVLVGLLLKPHFPAPKRKPEKNEEQILSRLEATIDLNACPEATEKAVMGILIRRTVVHGAGWGVLLLGSLVFLVCGANPVNFHSTEINSSMVNAMFWLIPCMAAPFAYGVFAAYYRRHSIRKEIALLKTAPAEARGKAEPEVPAQKKLLIPRLCILGVALGMLLYGGLLEGWMDVLTKAVNICTECIGLG